MEGGMTVERQEALQADWAWGLRVHNERKKMEETLIAYGKKYKALAEKLEKLHVVLILKDDDLSAERDHVRACQQENSRLKWQLARAEEYAKATSLELHNVYIENQTLREDAAYEESMRLQKQEDFSEK
jgi:hypothetical protein